MANEIKKIHVGTIDYDIRDDSAEKAANKVTLGSGNTTTQYPNAKSVWDECVNIREVAEGKCKTSILTTDETAITEANFSQFTLKKYDGTVIQSWSEFVSWLSNNMGDAPRLCNSEFIKNDDILLNPPSRGDYLLIDAYYSTYTVIALYQFTTGYADSFQGFKTGDIFLVTNTEVPDRWIGLSHNVYQGFYKLETSKVDIDSKVSKSGDSMTGDLTLSKSSGTKSPVIILQDRVASGATLSDSLHIYADAANGYVEGKKDRLYVKANAGLTLRGGGEVVLQSGSKYAKMPTDDSSSSSSVYTVATREWVNANKINVLIETTYSSLKTLRDNSQLIKGQQYRITDYNCTTTQFDTQSAGHQFDIIVTADDLNKLNENARAIKHSGDTYFANSKLESWELKYCLDNDTSRFAWASSSGKGVIYYMKDEFNNECPYDFKNIQFKRYKVTPTQEYLTDLNNKYLGFIGDMRGLTIPSESDFIWCYTFHTDTEAEEKANTDASLNDFDYTDADGGGYSGGDGSVRDNTIKANIVDLSAEEETQHNCYNLNNIVLISQCYMKGMEVIELKGTSNIHIDTKCYNITMIRGSGSRFNQKCYNNIFGDSGSNTFGNACSYNTFGNACSSNTFGNSCYSNTFGNCCESNTFENDCSCNTFGNCCYYNTFGNDCYYNTFGTNCDGNTFGTNCYSNTFGNDCVSNTLVSSGNPNYARYNIFENGVQYVDLKASTSGSSENYLQNITIRQGIKGINSTHKVITETRNLTHDVTYRAIGAEDKAI